MNPSQSYPPISNPGSPPPEDDAINFGAYLDMLVDSKWLIASIVGIALLIGVAYSMLAKPIYEADLLIQVEDSSGAAATKSLLGEASSLFDVKTPATGEIEILRSRMVVGRAADLTRYFIDAQPKYIPLVGSWLARRSNELSSPGFLGLPGYVSGAEKIVVDRFDVPTSFEGAVFTITVLPDGTYEVSADELANSFKGEIGKLTERTGTDGDFNLLISKIEGNVGAQFEVTRYSRSRVVDGLQDSLQLAEKGRQSGIINATMQGENRDKLVSILNEIGKQYVRQNIERKAAEAEKTLTFLDTQLPQFKRQLEESEETYNGFRNRNGTIALDEEARLALQQTVELQTKLFEAEQQRRELQARFTNSHPTVQTLNSQIAAWNSQITKLNERIKNMPALQQDSLRLQRDVEVNNELYQSLLNNALQLRLVREGKIGNVRLIDDAVVPTTPVKPRKPLVLVLSIVLGLLVGVIAAIARTALSRGIRGSQEIETQTGLNVYSTVPLSTVQASLTQDVSAHRPGMHVLAYSFPSDPAVEALRSLRTSLQFAMLEASNNRVLITGGTPGVGKSFISTNFAAVLASGGKRTLLIDADMRKGYINKFFDLARENGLSELIAGTTTLESAVHKDILPGLDLITTGMLPPNPAELLMSESFGRVLDSVSGEYDIVIIDTPPVLVAADTAAASQRVGIVLLVARFEQTHIGELLESQRQLGQSGKSVDGVVFNGIDATRRYNGRYGYSGGSYRYAQYDYAPHPASKI